MLQIFLSIGAITLLAIATLSMNRGFEVNDTVMRSSKYAVIATSLASSVIEEAAGKAFDEASTKSLLHSTADLTPSANFGLDGGETKLTRDDFDDYNGFDQNDTVDVGGALNKVVFSTTCRVTYVTLANPDLDAGSTTWFKKISVSITSEVMTDTVRQEMIFSYFRFE
ncbi:MAG TPA: hypothetical protein VJO14_00560 [Bacteroidota bacterium]|nr:hypothetical protein [Bacteroidota bacterium]